MKTASLIVDKEERQKPRTLKQSMTTVNVIRSKSEVKGQGTKWEYSAKLCRLIILYCRIRYRYVNLQQKLKDGLSNVNEMTKTN